MRLRADPIKFLAALAGGLLLSGCAGGPGPLAAGETAGAARTIQAGPAGDYPMVLGDPYVVDGVTYTPSDTLNVDEVGLAGAEGEPGAGVTAAHRTLPLPSYVEVTALDTGRTALVRVERRGPMTGARLVGLSEGALAQLGIADGAPVRVRRVNPAEEDRAKLRTGEAAPLRMDTPAGLLTVLERRLPASGSASLFDPRQAQVSGSVPTPGALAALDPDTEAALPAAPAPVAAPPQPAEPAPALPVAAQEVRYFVQLGAFSVRANADRLAAKVGGEVATSGRLAIVRTGPYASRGQAEEALAKLRAQGYSDARIVSPN